MFRSAKSILAAAVVFSIGAAYAADKKPPEKAPMPVAAAAAVAAPVAAAAVWTGPAYGYGRIATNEEIDGWARTVRAIDGKGLPAGTGDATQGEDIFQTKCGMCHGDFGEGTRYLALVGGKGTLATPDPIRTVGSFWPYAPGVFGYIYTSMPFGQAHSLTADETYGIVAYILYLNDLYPQDAPLNADTLRAVTMPNRNGFIEGDPRPDMPQPTAGEPCMKDCRGGRPVVVLSRANDLGVTPDTKAP